MSVLTLVPTPRAAPDSCTDDDGGLLPALAAGDPTAWQATVPRYEGLLRSAARVVPRGDADIDEAVQRRWVLLFRNADRIDDARCLPGWLFTTARREALAILRVSSVPSPARTSPTVSPPTRPMSRRRSCTTNCAAPSIGRSRRCRRASG